MKPSKLSSRIMKTTRTSPMRKSLVMKKGLSRSPHRSSAASRLPKNFGSRISRPYNARLSPPQMKRPLPSGLRKRSCSPHRHSSLSPPRRPVSHRGISPLTVDRDRDPKRRDPIYDKGKRYFTKNKGSSSSPPSRNSLTPPRSLGPQSHVSDRYAESRSEHQSRYDSSPKKSSSMYRQIPLVDSHSKEVSTGKPIFNRENVDPFKRSGGNHSERYPSESEKQYGTTLDERFRSVSETNRVTESRIHYTREDLEKITIDIHRNLRDHSPTQRRIINPADVKLVRRPDEGRRPIFDREEIKQAPRDLREDAYFEHKMMAGIRESGMSSYGLNLREIENYEITRHRFDMYHQPINSASGRSLSDRWQNLDSRKDATSLDRDEREYERTHPPRDFDSDRQRSRSTDRDFRSERYSGGDVHSKTDYSASHHKQLGSSSLSVRRKEGSLPDARQRIGRRDSPGRRSESQNLLHSHAEKRYQGTSEGSRGPSMSRTDSYRTQSSNLPSYMVKRHKVLTLDEKMKVIHSITVKKLTVKHVQETFKCGRAQIYDALKNRDEIKHEWVKGRHSTSRHGSGLEPPRFEVRSKEGSSKDEKLPDFSRRPDKYNYKPWLEKPDVTPKGPSYFEHDNRERNYRGRSLSRPFRSFRGGYRGRSNFRFTRGSTFRSRGSFRGFMTNATGRGLSSRRGRYSPSHWEHDLYSRSSQDRKSGSHAT